MPDTAARTPYWRILMSQLTIFEVKYIFYSCLVAPEHDNLRNLLQRSELSRHRILESTINRHHLEFYRQLHGFALIHQKPRIVMPFDKPEQRRIRKRLSQFAERNRVVPGGFEADDAPEVPESIK